MGISYQVTDVEGPVAAVSSVSDGGMMVVFSPQGVLVYDETPMKPVGSIDLKRENRTLWMDLLRAGTGGVRRMMALRREQPVEQVEQIAGRRGRRRHILRIPSCKTMRKPRLQGHGNHHLDPRLNSWTNFLVQTLCFGQGQGRYTSTHCNTRRSDTKGDVGLDVLHKLSRAGRSIACVSCLRSFHWCGDDNAVQQRIPLWKKLLLWRRQWRRGDTDVVLHA